MVQHGWAPKTRTGYATAVRRYLTFASQHLIDPLPLSEEKIACFIAFLDVQALSHRTVKTYLAGLRAWVIAMGLPEPNFWSPKIHLMIKSMHKARPPPPQPLPITFPLLTSMVNSLSNSQDHLMLAAAMTLQFFACLRASELCSDGNPGSPPLRSSVHFPPNKTPPIMVYTVSKSKTNPHGFQVHLGCSGHQVCAVCIIHLLISSRPVSPTSPLFKFSSGAPLTYQLYNTAIKQIALGAGIDPSRVSSHSFRAGAATQAASAGLESHNIQRLGRWRSDAYTTYMRPSPESYALLAPHLTSSTPQPPANLTTMHS